MTKNIIKTISFFLSLLLLFSLVACGRSVTPQTDTTPSEEYSDYFNIEGWFLKTDSGIMILKEDVIEETEGERTLISPIIIENAGDFNLSALENGDLFSVTIDTIRETYPGFTTMYGDFENAYTIIKKNDPDFSKCDETIEQLKEMGHNVITDEETPTGWDNPEPVEEAMNNLADNTAKLGTMLLTHATEQDFHQNILISPLSLYEDIALLSGGVSGKTKEEIEENILSADVETTQNSLYHFNNALMSQSVNVANSVWLNENIIGKIGLNGSYADNAKKFLSAEVEAIPYDEIGVKQINDWVNKQTHEMIPEIVKELSEEEIIHLINALAFESEWETPYEDIDIRETYTFTELDGKIDSVNMLFSYGEKVTEVEDQSENIIADAFTKPYKDGRTAFVGILPREEYTPEGVASALASENKNIFTEMCRSFDFYDGDVTVGIPEFSLDYSLEMSEILQSMGMKTAFTPDADFSGMFIKDSVPVSVGGVLQKTHIEVDRKGTKAAAVTDIMVGEGAVMEENPPKIIILDRPFVYAIIDIETGMPYFMGVQYNYD